MTTKQISDSSFESDVLKAEGPVVVDFWAEWCGPCKMIGPALEELSDEMSNDVTITKLNIDDHPETPGQLGVRGIPTMMLFKDGKVVDTKVGAAPKAQIKQWIEAAL